MLMKDFLGQPVTLTKTGPKIIIIQQM